METHAGSLVFAHGSTPPRPPIATAPTLSRPRAASPYTHSQRPRQTQGAGHERRRSMTATTDRTHRHKGSYLISRMRSPPPPLTFPVARGWRRPHNGPPSGLQHNSLHNNVLCIMQYPRLAVTACEGRTGGKRTGRRSRKAEREGEEKGKGRKRGRGEEARGGAGWHPEAGRR